MHSTIRVSALSLLLLCLFGCAAAPAKKDPRDPWERMNRTTFNFNNAVDHAVLRPVARGYQKITPGFVRTGVSNFLDNLGYPLVIVNDLLQFRLTPFAHDTGRFLMNTTLGIAGFLDPASEAGLEKNENDFGLTFGRWGIPKGPYFVIPLLGPSDVRDGLGKIPTAYLAPQNFANSWQLQWSIWVIQVVDTRYRLLPADPTIESAYDPYLFLKNAYLQRRDFLLSQGSNQPTENESDAEKLLDEATKDEEQESTPNESKPEQSKSEQPQPDQAKPDSGATPPK
jgi:phospholipid-binding lipoprotein MlaA